jgi:alpha-L-fucosidase 2
MKRSFGKFALLFAVVLPCCTGSTNLVQTGFSEQRIGLSYTYPKTYKDWPNGYLAGNGKMGIIVFCNPLDETVIFNDRKFYMAASVTSPERSFNKVSEGDLKLIRDYCTNENWKAANDLANQVHGWKNGGEGSKHPGFEMKINIPESGDIRNYSRVCDYRTGEIIVKWTDNRGKWERRAFVSRKDNVVVQYIKAPSGSKLNCIIQLTTDEGMHFPVDMKFTDASNSDFLNLRVNYPANTNSAGYEGVTRVVVDGGKKSINGSILTVTNAKAVTLLTRTEKYYSDCENQWNKNVIQNQLESLSPNYNTLLKAQKETHQVIFDRVKLGLNASAADRALSNEELLAMQKSSATAVMALWERVFDAGRYHFLSSSDEVSPPDLLGNWTGDCKAGWNGYYFLDANLNLQISGGNIGDMPEAMEGYFTLIERLKNGFKTNATKLLGCRGMLSGGNLSGLNGLIGALNYYFPYQYVTGEMGWLLYPFWEHYLITGDKEFLRNRLFPLLKEMGYFYEDFLVNKDKDGNFIFAGSISPESQPAGLKLSLVNNSTFDIAGARFCLSTLIKTCDILGVQQELSGDITKWKTILDKMPPYLINDDGALREWAWPGLMDDYGHRHSSHLITVWPLNEITPESPSELYKAAQTALNKKDEHNYQDAGHGIVHSALIAANLNNATSVNSKILRLLKTDFYFTSMATAHYSNFKVFCTDVCNSVPAIMIEMLVNSTSEVIDLLPAIPESLTKGAVAGIKARNRVTIKSLSWDLEKSTIECILESDIDQQITLVQRRGIKSILTSAKVSPSSIGNTARVIEMKAGQPIKISLQVNDLPKNLALYR